MAQIYATSYKFLIESTRNFIKFYEHKYKILQQEIIEHEKNEPLKIFKQTHKNWKSKREQLNTELEQTLNNLMKEYKDFGNLI